MSIIIGDKPDSDFADPIGLLKDCHRRIEKFLDLLVAIANEAKGKPLGLDHRVAVETALCYFREAAPKHTADEEESLFPRIRNSGYLDANEIVSDLDRLQADHLTTDEAHRVVSELFRQWLVNDLLLPDEVVRLMLLLRSLRDIYTRHITEEETRVFPYAASRLTRTDLKAVGLEMARRRGLAAKGFSRWDSG